MSWIKRIFETFTDNPPSIAIALGGIMLLVGYLVKERELINAGLVFFFAGVGLQCYFFLFTRPSHNKQARNYLFGLVSCQRSRTFQPSGAGWGEDITPCIETTHENE